jgi:hypothetical protein
MHSSFARPTIPTTIASASFEKVKPQRWLATQLTQPESKPRKKAIIPPAAASCTHHRYHPRHDPKHHLFVQKKAGKHTKWNLRLKITSSGRSGVLRLTAFGDALRFHHRLLAHAQPSRGAALQADLTGVEDSGTGCTSFPRCRCVCTNIMRNVGRVHRKSPPGDAGDAVG